MASKRRPRAHQRRDDEQDGRAEAGQARIRRLEQFHESQPQSQQSADGGENVANSRINSPVLSAPGIDSTLPWRGAPVGPAPWFPIGQR